MTTRLSRSRSALAVLLATLLFGAGCGAEKPQHPEARVPALRFAGVDLEYALDRLATEAGWVLGLDEIMLKDGSPDMQMLRVDVDLPAGTLEEAMRVLREKVGRFDYALYDGVLYVRSNRPIEDQTTLDVPLLQGGSFHGELVELVKYIMLRHPSSYIAVSHLQGGFAGPPVDLEIPPKASVKDALILYARTAKAGWAIKRAGTKGRNAQGALTITGTSIQPRGPRKSTSRLPRSYNQLSLAAALADATTRLQTPIVVYDRSVLQEMRGMLNFALLSDPNLPLKETLDILGQSGFGPSKWHYRWREEDGLPVLRSRHFLFFLRGRDLFSQELLAGEFEGSLPEFARWINTHQKSPNGEVLMGGEIAEGQKRGKIAIQSGETVHQAIIKFAKASGVTPYVIVFDMQNPITGVMIDNPLTWRGAFLQDISEWHTQPGDEQAMGATIKEEAK